jgi:hypothetical protein
MVRGYRQLVLGITGVFDAKIDPDGVLKKPVPPIVKSREPKKELVKLKPIPLMSSLTYESEDGEKPNDELNSGEVELDGQELTEDPVWNLNLWSKIGATTRRKHTLFKKSAISKPSLFPN